ncbi:MAG: hypothetical protein WEG36_00685 [Gemmatimonadota bacterium]
MAERSRASWLEESEPVATEEASSPTGNGTAPYVDLGSRQQDAFEAEVDRLREEARRIARADAASGVPAPESMGPTESEIELKNRCTAFFARWQSRERRGLVNAAAEHEERLADALAQANLGVDRFQRLTNELVRLKARREMRRREVTKELESEGARRDRGLPTPVYAGALFFLGVVEFFANAPVFGTLLPRDPLTERQIRLLTEASTGWIAGLERVGAHIIFRPDAALLAAGVITLLCVLGHFFGHSLRDLVMQGERRGHFNTVQSRSARENIVPLVLSAVGLVLVLGVLFQARVQLGEVGAERYTNDMAQVEELRRQAGWLRVDGEILSANELTNRAEDMENAATELREYSLSMSRMNVPILLLNLTLVLCAISAAYFHRRDGRSESFNEHPFEEDRKAFADQGEQCAKETAQLLADVMKEARALRTLSAGGHAMEWRSALHQLDSVLATYRSENGRARRLDPHAIAAFRTPLRLDVEALEAAGGLTLRDPEEYVKERNTLSARFDALRSQFNEEVAFSC